MLCRLNRDRLRDRVYSREVPGDLANSGKNVHDLCFPQMTEVEVNISPSKALPSSISVCISNT